MKRVKESDQIKDNIDGTLIKMLDHYTCPADCDVFCCKKLSIEMTPKERKILRKKTNEKLDNLKTIIHGDKYYVLEPPCPFLGVDDLCTVYNLRPIRCRTYPLNLAEKFPLIITVNPCKMGVKISEDYFEYKLLKLKESNEKNKTEQELKLLKPNFDSIH